MLNLCIQALKLNQNKAGYSLNGCYLGAIMGSVKIVKINACKNTSYTVLSTPFQSAFIKLHTMNWTSDPHACIIQHPDMLACHLTSVCNN